MKLQNSLNVHFFSYELLLFSLNDLKKYHGITFNSSETFDFIGNSWLKKTASLIHGGRYNYIAVKMSIFPDSFLKDYSYSRRKKFKNLVIQNAFVILFRLSFLKEFKIKAGFFPNKGVNFLK